MTASPRREHAPIKRRRDGRIGGVFASAERRGTVADGKKVTASIRCISDAERKSQRLPNCVSAGQEPFSDWWAILGLNQ
jgi:hypothetical protein